MDNTDEISKHVHAIKRCGPSAIADAVRSLGDWEAKYKALEGRLLREAYACLLHAPLRPSMFIGRFIDYRDAHFLIHIISDAFDTVCHLKGKDQHEFQLRNEWGVGASRYGRNIDTNRTMEQNQLKIKEMADDFLVWAEVKDEAEALYKQVMGDNEAVRAKLVAELATAGSLPWSEDAVAEWCSNNDCERPACHRCYPQAGCQEHHKCSKMTWES